MTKLLATPLGRLRILAFLEGTSLLLLIFVAVPLKRIWDLPELVRAIGPVHGLLFLLFVLSTLSVALKQKWSFTQTTWKVLIACLIPFGTFYVDHRILKPKMQQAEAL